MTLITLKFSPEMERAVMEGRKCMTTRLKSKGSPGDVFLVRDRLYRLLTVQHNHNIEFLRYCYRDEGFNSFQEFKDALLKIYPDAELVPIMVHTFAYVCDVCPDFNLECNSCVPQFCPAAPYCNNGVPE